MNLKKTSFQQEKFYFNGKKKKTRGLKEGRAIVVVTYANLVALFVAVHTLSNVSFILDIYYIVNMIER
jgi:hypothetical protein